MKCSDPRIEQTLIAALSVLILGGCASAPEARTAPDSMISVTVEETWLTQRNEGDNVDSIATWTNDQRSWLLATAKETDILIIFDAATGERLGETGGRGNAPGRLLRPNGIFVVDDRVWIVERDNRRVQVLDLPDFRPILIFSESELQKPYGIYVHRIETGYRVFVTDSYATVDERVPPDAELDGRLHRFDIASNGDALSLDSHQRLGPTEGPGRLLKVESLWADPERGMLLVADEHPTRLNLKRFDLEGRYSYRTLADGALRHEPEGMALYRCDDGTGLWIVTDQDPLENRFLVFDRRDFRQIGVFSGATTSNTDGVWLHAGPLPGFPRGVFYAVHDDGSVAAFDWGEVLDTLGQDQCTRPVLN